QYGVEGLWKFIQNERIGLGWGSQIMESRGGGAAATGMSSRRSGSSAKMRKDAYRQTGVDTAEADAGLVSIVNRLIATWPQEGDGRVGRPLLPFGPDGY